MANGDESDSFILASRKAEVVRGESDGSVGACVVGGAKMTEEHEVEEGVEEETEEEKGNAEFEDSYCDSITREVFFGESDDFS